MNRRKYHQILEVMVGLLLLVGLILTYARHFHNPFHFDDNHTIVNNVSIRDVKSIPDFFTNAQTSSSLPANQSYRPIVTTLNSLDYAFATQNPFQIKESRFRNDKGLIPFYFHFSIFISFVFTGLLIFLLVKKVFAISYPSPWNNMISLFVAALFCYHAAVAETVNYIISRSDGFSTFLGLLSLVVYGYFPTWRKYQMHVLLLFFSFFVKESALMFVPILFLYIWLIEQQVSLLKFFSKDTLKHLRYSLKQMLFPLLAVVIYSLLNYFFRSHTNVYATSSRIDYLITQPYVIFHYFLMFFYPSQLSADTDWVAISSIFHWKFLVGIVFVFCLILIILLASSHKVMRPVSFGLAWFLLALLPTSSIVPLAEVLNDHRMYFPFVGLALALVWSLMYYIFLRNNLLTRFPLSKVFLTMLAVIIILSHASATQQRCEVWSSEENLWYDVTVKSPENGRGLMNYGLTQMSKGNYPVAEKYFLKALKYTPNYSLLYVNLGVLYAAMNNPKLAEDNFKKSIALNTYTYQCNFYYGKFLKDQQRFTEAVYYLKKSVDENPQFLEGRHGLMEAYLMTQQWELLRNLANETLTLLPGDVLSQKYIKLSENNKSSVDIAMELVKQQPTAENYLELSLRYYENAMYAKCIDACYLALKINPAYAPAYNNICAAYNQVGEYEKAIAACNKALELQPEYDLAKNNLRIAKDSSNSPQ